MNCRPKLQEFACNLQMEPLVSVFFGLISCDSQKLQKYLTLSTGLFITDIYHPLNYTMYSHYNVMIWGKHHLNWYHDRKIPKCFWVASKYQKYHALLTKSGSLTMLGRSQIERQIPAGHQLRYIPIILWFSKYSKNQFLYILTVLKKYENFKEPAKELMSSFMKTVNSFKVF